MNRPLHVLHLDEAECVMLGDEKIPFIETFMASFVDLLEQCETLILDLVGSSFMFDSKSSTTCLQFLPAAGLTSLARTLAMYPSA